MQNIIHLQFQTSALLAITLNDTPAVSFCQGVNDSLDLNNNNNHHINKIL